MISVPILAHFLPVSYLVPLMALLDMASATHHGHARAASTSRSAEMKRIIPFMFVGFVVGVTVLVGVPDEYLRIGARRLRHGRRRLQHRESRRAARPSRRGGRVPVGIVGGAIATVFGAGGPIYATYLSGRLEDKTEIRATMSTLISISAFTRALVYAVTGLMLHVAIFAGLVVLAPFVWMGLKLGNRIHVGLTQQQMRRAIGVRAGAHRAARSLVRACSRLMAKHPPRPPRAFLAKHGVAVHRARVRVRRARRHVALVEDAGRARA